MPKTSNNLVSICLILADKVYLYVIDQSIDHWAYFVGFPHKRPLPASDHFVLHHKHIMNQGWFYSRELTVVLINVISVNTVKVIIQLPGNSAKQ